MSGEGAIHRLGQPIYRPRDTKRVKELALLTLQFTFEGLTPSLSIPNVEHGQGLGGSPHERSTMI